MKIELIDHKKDESVNFKLISKSGLTRAVELPIDDYDLVLNSLNYLIVCMDIPVDEAKGISATLKLMMIDKDSVKAHEWPTFPELSPEMTTPKQPRYTDENGKDLIDKWEERYSIEEFRVLMWAMIEKYNERLGKKDDIVKEVTKIADYSSRWLQAEKRAK